MFTVQPWVCPLNETWHFWPILFLQNVILNQCLYLQRCCCHLQGLLGPIQTWGKQQLQPEKWKLKIKKTNNRPTWFCSDCLRCALGHRGSLKACTASSSPPWSVSSSASRGRCCILMGRDRARNCQKNSRYHRGKVEYNLSQKIRIGSGRF